MASRKRKPMRYRSKSRKKSGFSSAHAILPTIATIAAAGLICCFGYIVAKPIVQSTNGSILMENDVTESSEQSAEETTAQTTAATEATTETTHTTVTHGSEQKEGNVTEEALTTNVVIISGGETTAHTGTAGFSGVDGTQVDVQFSGEGTVTTTVTADTAGGSGDASGNEGGNADNNNNGGSTVPTGSGVYKTVSHAVRLPESSVTSADGLKKMLENVKEQNPTAGAVVIPMKMAGGALNYQSYAAGDAAWTVCQGQMTASEIAAIVRDAGLCAYASCNMLEDHLYPTVYSCRQASYMIEKNGVQNGDQWLDNYADKGGKPWLDPNSAVTQNYLSGIINELADSGFSAVLCSGFTYPSFGPSDEKYLNPDIFAKNPDPMTNLANALYQAAGSKIDVVLELDAYAANNGWELVYQKDKLKVPYTLFDNGGNAASEDGAHSVITYSGN